jgi:hypothetical protein
VSISTEHTLTEGSLVQSLQHKARPVRSGGLFGDQGSTLRWCVGQSLGDGDAERKLPA